jgi:ankyrin repeat protein
VVDTGGFFEAVKEGDAEAVREELRRNPSLARARTEAGESPLLLATYYGQAEVVAALREVGPEPDLFEAAALGETERVRANLERSPGGIDDFSGDGFTPLQLAAYFGHADTALLLLERGADVAPVSRHPMQVTAIHACVASGNPSSRTDIARALLDRGADVNARHPGGYTPLHAAAQNGDLELARLLLDRGANWNAVTDEGKSPLAYAEEGGHGEVAALIRSAGGTQG